MQICVNIPPTMATKATSLRLPEEMAAELAAVARADDMPMSEVVREAIEKHITERRADGDFQKRVKELLEEDQEVLKRLAK
ncbi:MAG TPA: ribbon-helix-helix protein, CopG family [Solirubrobacterales bacterium]|nr:ribbon-helix-helix protein, CopG family [Solirubrobacterales bacterium]